MSYCAACGRGRQRLTASPGRLTVWVQETQGDPELLLQPRDTVQNPDAVHRDGWVRLSTREWDDLRGLIDSYFEALTGSKAGRPEEER